jgi:hypothetical protein
MNALAQGPPKIIQTMSAIKPISLSLTTIAHFCLILQVLQSFALENCPLNGRNYRCFHCFA